MTNTAETTFDTAGKNVKIGLYKADGATPLNGTFDATDGTRPWKITANVTLASALLNITAGNVTLENITLDAASQGRVVNVTSSGSDATLTIESGTTIQGGLATSEGGGVFHMLGATFNIGRTTDDANTITITGNWKGAIGSTTDNVFLHYSYITMTKSPAAYSSIGVWATSGAGSAVANGSTNPAYTIQSTDARFFTSNQPTVAGVNFSINTLILQADYVPPSTEPETTPGAAINYATEKLTGLMDGAMYTIGGTDYTATDGVIAIDQTWLGTTISIVKKGNGTTTSNSTPQSLAIPSRSVTAPTSPVGGWRRGSNNRR